jgi:hypothetical protein
VPSTVRHDIGQLLVGSLPGTTVTPEIRSLAREFQLGGIILFARNIEGPEQVAELSHDIQQLATELPLWVSVDQEGGRVARLKAPFTEWPPMAVLGRSGDVQLAARFARALARELRAVGVTLDYAPVLDIHTNPRNPVIGSPRMRQWWAAWGRRSSRRCRRTAWRRAANIFPATATRRWTRTSSCRSWSIRPTGFAASSASRSAPPSRPTWRS